MARDRNYASPDMYAQVPKDNEMQVKECSNETSVVILGAGPAGLTAAYELSNLGVPCIVLERDSVVGGLARTVEHQGFRFDIGGHRFYTKVSLVKHIWEQILGEDLLTRTRLSRIYYKSKFFRYPLEPLDALRGLGLMETILCGLSFLKSRAFPKSPEEDFESWVTNRFGRRLFETFFKSYTEKVWGMDCGQIRADWAAQRIRGLSLWALLRDAMLPGAGKEVKTLIREFKYPRLGPGMLWSRMQDLVEQRNVRIVLNAPVQRVNWESKGVVSVQACGKTYKASHFLSSIPIRELVYSLDPTGPQQLRAAAEELKYRDFITVALMVRAKNLFPDNWIYIHDPNVMAGRIQNYKNWSPEMTPGPDVTCLGVEYFCNDSDALWCADDDKLIELAQSELVQLGLLRKEDVIGGVVARMPKAYPVYTRSYQQALMVVRDFLSTVPNLQFIGRNGMHRYNNQDHSMLTGILAARNVAGARFDLWNLNLDQDYLEDGTALTNEEIAALNESQPLMPKPV
jgi:protoporphyrinogen oxidase